MRVTVTRNAQNAAIRDAVRTACRGFVAATGCLVLASAGKAALASDATAASPAATASPDSAVSLNEVIVTAQRRAENVQTVPLSISTFSGASLKQQAITSFFGYGTKVPNLGFAMSGDGVGTSRTVAIRGISGNNTTGFYIDDVPLPDSIDPRVLDTDHIEVLRGPQGTLFGARSMGGTVRIITKTPDLERFSADVHTELSDTWNTTKPNYTGDAVVNIPLIRDRLALRVSGFYDQEAGFLRRSYCNDPQTTAYNLNATPTCTPLSVYTNPSLVTVVKNVAENDTYGGTAALTFKPTDSLTITPRFMTQRSDYNGFPMTDVNTDTANGYGYPVPAPAVPPMLPTLEATDFMQARMFNLPEGGHDTWNLASLSVHWKTGLGELISSTAYFDRNVYERENVSSWVYASLTGGYQAIPDVSTEQKKYQSLVEEVRFVSQLKGPLQFVTGAFYSTLHGALPFAANYPANDAPGIGNILFNVFQACPPNAPLGTYFCPNPKNPDEIFGEHYYTKTQEFAVYGQSTYDLTSALRLTAGLRWSQDQTTAFGYQEGAVTESVQDYYAGIGQIVDAPTTTRESTVTPKVAVDYHITPHLMTYVTAAKGFRPGGLAPSVPAALCGTQLPPGITADQTRQFRSDSLWNYEIGEKSSWLDNRLTVDAAAYYIDWKNIQQLILLGCGFQYQANAGAATSKGGELEIHARPLNPLEVSLALGYENATISQSGNDSPQRPGDPVFYVPDWTATASADWTRPVSANDAVSIGLDYSYIGRSFSANNLSGVNNFATRERPSYRITDAHITWIHDPWEVGLVGKNLANEHANLDDSRSIGAETTGRPRLIVNQPRTIGIEARYHFD